MTAPAAAFAEPCRTQRLTIAPLVKADAAAVRAITDHPVIAAAIPFVELPFTKEDAERLIAGSDGDRECFLGLWREQVLSGVIGVHLREAPDIELGYWIGVDFHGQGLSQEALKAVAARLHAHFSNTRLVAECKPDNAASRRVLEKAGFRPTGGAGTRPGRKLFVHKYF